MNKKISAAEFVILKMGGDQYDFGRCPTHGVFASIKTQAFKCPYSPSGCTHDLKEIERIEDPEQYAKDHQRKNNPMKYFNTMGGDNIIMINEMITNNDKVSYSKEYEIVKKIFKYLNLKEWCIELPNFGDNPFRRHILVFPMSMPVKDEANDTHETTLGCFFQFSRDEQMDDNFEKIFEQRVRDKFKWIIRVLFEALKSGNYKMKIDQSEVHIIDMDRIDKIHIIGLTEEHKNKFINSKPEG